ncbi:transcriptional regulator [Desulfurivibrio alkaliphilus AHT 2]|uniref:Transcriptional regulator n=1 Tax=Desulfurivibrio alkaliphilus (strain DSM 19089 / UNIQEM U267 / AHT2) TaxID=589865 RepID=D6Z115_DESAT|nr:transcriptional regulator [Desulfurivibrio alkaliphilus AHT 2]
MQVNYDREQTIPVRRQIAELLVAGTLSARDLSTLLSLPEREIYGHLEHLQRSLQSSGQKLVVIPSRCLKCEFEFSKRSRLKKPGRCPRCRATHISAPLFNIINT